MGKQVVKDVSYLNGACGDVYGDRDHRAIFDVYCEGENGEKFIVEMQNAYQTYFKIAPLLLEPSLSRTGTKRE